MTKKAGLEFEVTKHQSMLINRLKEYKFTLVSMENCPYCVEFKNYTWGKFSTCFEVEEFDESVFNNRWFEGFPTVIITEKNEPFVEVGLVDGFKTFTKLLEDLVSAVDEYQQEKSTPGISISV